MQRQRRFSQAASWCLEHAMDQVSRRDRRET